jgi:hypothetical protein
MNERYEQLMAQAWIEFAPDAKAVTKRFAELIVRECAMFVVTELEGKVGSLIADATANRLEEHFGVE